MDGRGVPFCEILESVESVIQTFSLPSPPKYSSSTIHNLSFKTMSDLAKQLIEKEKRERTGYLDLGNCGLKKLPDLSEMDWLKTIMLAGEWWDWENRKFVRSRNFGNANQLGAPNNNLLPKGVEKIILSNCKIKDGYFLKDLVKLKLLDISKNLIINGDFIQNLKELESLDIHENQIKKCDFIVKLRKLKTLNLSKNRISNADFLENFNKITSLDLGNNNKSHEGPRVTYFTREHWIDLSDNQIMDWSFFKKYNKFSSLNLRNNQIKDWHFLEKITGLTSLDISQNNIRDGHFLEKLPKLAGLKWLDLSRNEIKDGRFLEKLPELTTLRLNSNQISDIHFLRKLPQLHLLNLSSNHISDIRILEYLTDLRFLDISSNPINDISIFEHTPRLYRLDLSSTQISDIRNLAYLVDLQSLDLRNNQISDIRFLEKLIKLNRLDLVDNQISDITPLLPLIKKGVPVAIEENAYEEIKIRDNPLTVPPQEVVAQGNEAIIKWFESNEKRPILEAKVMFIGDSGYGKTHLIEMLLKGCIGGRVITTTLGIERNRLPDATSHQGSVRLNVWDLGGQEFMRSTHQFFFTTRTLYVLVTDARQGERREDLRHWLNLVKELGENAPVLIVINKIDQNEHDIDRERLDREYENIVGYVRTCVYDNLEKGIVAQETIKNLREAIEKVATDAAIMPEVFVLQRPEWFQVKEALECENRPYITIEDYRKIEQIASLSLDEQDFGLRQMAFIGTVVSYHKDPRLADTHVIDPKWIMDGIYAILNDGIVKDDKKGEFCFDDMRRILDRGAYPDGKLPFLTDLMRKFKLCYPLRGSSNTFLLPDLFSDAEPPGVWVEESVLRFRFNYDTYPPDAFMAQFIAAKYESIDDEKRWRSGVVIQNGQCRAVVRRSFKYEHIEIEVAGPERQRRGYLHSIRETFYDLQRPFGTLNPKEELPWKNEWLNFKDLLSAEADGDEKYRIPGGERVQLSEVLDGYAVESDRAFFMREIGGLKSELATIKRIASDTEINTVAILSNQDVQTKYLESLLVYAEEHRASLVGIFAHVDALPPASSADIERIDALLETRIKLLMEKIPSSDEIVKAWKAASKKLPGEVDNKLKVKTKLALVYGMIPKWSHEVELEHSVDPTTFLNSADGRPFLKRLQEDVKAVLAGKKEWKDLLIETD